MDVEKETEFPEERKGVRTQLESIAWHCNNLLCPFCMEKHDSLVMGLSSEIADGKEGDEATYRQLSDEASKVMDKLQINKAQHGFTEEDVNFYRDWARAWRRKLSGASADGHNHAENVTKHKTLMEMHSSPGSEIRKEIAEEAFEHPQLSESEAEEIVTQHHHKDVEEEKLFKRCIAQGNSIEVCRHG